MQIRSILTMTLFVALAWADGLAQTALSAPQQPEADITPTREAPVAPRKEALIEGFTRKDRDSVSLAFPAEAGAGKTLLLHDFDFNGEPVDSAKLHLRQLSPGVFELSSLAYTVGYWRFHVTDTASYYGLGEHFNTLDHAHEIVRNLSMDNSGPRGSSADKCIPFFLSTTGYGLWLDTTGEATFDMNASDPENVIVDAVSNRLRVVLFMGPFSGKRKARFPQILEHFTALATQLPGGSRAIVPPYWAFAPWEARGSYRNEAEVLEDIDRTRELGLPASVLLIDSPWATAYNSYRFNPEQFDDAPGMVKHLHQSGFKLVLGQTSWINSHSDPPQEPGLAGKPDATSPNYDEAARNGFFVKNVDGTPWVGHWGKGQGSLIDFTSPRAKRWWQDQVRQATTAGADGFKNDDAEGALFSSGAGGEARFADGTNPRLMRNRYGTLYNNAVEELIQKDLKSNGVLFARSVTTGANGIGFLWGGDNDASFSPENGLPTVVTAGLSAGLSGMPLWGAHLGGFFSQPDTPNPLLLERWAEFSAFSPTMEIMSTASIVPLTSDRSPGVAQKPGSQTTDPAPVPGAAAALDIYRKFAILHMSLFPYRYAAAQQAAKTGLPLLCALVLDFQDDARARTIKDEYLFGPDLLVAPVVDENTSRVVYLPAGDWLNLFTGEPVTGPRTLIAQAPADSIPVYARRGTILPRIPEDVMTLVPQSESGNTSVHSLDDRRIYEILGPAAVENGSPMATSITDFEGRTVLRSENSLQITGDSAAHILLRFRFLTPHQVTVNGVPASIETDASGVSGVEFDHSSTSTVVWQ